MHRPTIFLVSFAVLCSMLPAMARAQEPALITDTVAIEKARVTDIADERTLTIPATDTETREQLVTATVLSGADAGASVTFTNDYTQLSVGDTFYLRHTTNELDGADYYAVSDPYRLDTLAVLGALFIGLAIFFGRWQGARGLTALAGSLVLIAYVLIPGILHGFSPVLVSIMVSSFIIVLGSYVTHGFNRTTSAAVFGMIATVLVTGIGAFTAVHAADLSGYASEESVYLNFDTRGQIDLVGLLFSGMIIGLLGVLYDIAISQAIAVEELFRAGAHMTRAQIYARAIRMGREHIGALINTLAIAYVGAALPLLLLVQSSTYGLLFTANSELFATEIIRILIGSIGVILGVPITTLIASYMLSATNISQTPTGHSHH